MEYDKSESSVEERRFKVTNIEKYEEDLNDAKYDAILWALYIGVITLFQVYNFYNIVANNQTSSLSIFAVMNSILVLNINKFHDAMNKYKDIKDGNYEYEDEEFEEEFEEELGKEGRRR